MRFGNYCPIITFKIFSSFQACLIKLLYTFYSVKPVYQSVRTKITHLFIFREKIIPQTLNSQTLLFRKSQLKEKKGAGRQEEGGGQMQQQKADLGPTATRHKRTFTEDGTVPYLHYAGGYMTVYTCQNSRCIIKMGIFIVYKLSLN